MSDGGRPKVAYTVVSISNRNCVICRNELPPMGKRTKRKHGGYTWANEGKGWVWMAERIGTDGRFPREPLALVFADGQEVRICTKCDREAEGIKHLPPTEVARILRGNGDPPVTGGAR